jgi:hypothetical protein
MAADAWLVYDKFKEYMADGTMDLDGDTFKIVLLASTYTPALTHSTYADISGDELATAYGYTNGGQALASVTWNESGGTVTFDCANPAWTASGGSIVCRYAAIYDDTATNDELVCYSLLDNTPADVTTTDGNTLTIAISTNGIFQLS